MTLPVGSEPELLDLLRRFSTMAEGLRRSHERLETELREKNDLLRRRDRLAELGEMAAGVAHEIRNPLGGISLYAGLLVRRLEEGDTRRLAEKIQEGVRQLETVVHDMLVYTRDARPACAPCDLAVLVREAAPSGEGPLRVEVEGAHSAVVAAADAGLVRRALDNLVRNACEAMEGRGTLTLRLAEEPSRVRIEVADTGPGVPVEDRERIFNPFFTRKVRGTGLGLAIVHRIVDAHGGAVRVGSSPCGGACFTIVLPREARGTGEEAHAA
ncbi:MAG: sensor histidine kinase [Planctomycetes bacterium]|nr:sensor histidine kinase [Planctomycetota bacterium]